MKQRRVLPSINELNWLFLYESETGRLIWRKRPVEVFHDLRSAKNWNTKYAGKVAGCVSKDSAVVVNMNGQNIYAHRIIFKMCTGQEPSHIDHADLDCSNNKISNLRSADDMSNGWNVAGHGCTVSGLKNVYFHRGLRNRPWRASVTKAGKGYSGPYRSSKEEAFADACTLRSSLHGEFCRHQG